MEIVMMKAANGTFAPMTTYDKSQADDLPVGQAIKVKIKKMKPRSYQFHKLYFGGLLELAADYFEPSNGLVQRGETLSIKGFIRFVERMMGGIQQGLRNLYGMYIRELRNSRAQRIAQPEMKPHEIINLLHDWVKKEAGLYDLVFTPTGMEKKVLSISFDSMSDIEFEQYFKAAYDVIWRFILSKKFPSQEDYDNALNKLMAMN